MGEDNHCSTCQFISEAQRNITLEARSISSMDIHTGRIFKRISPQDRSSRNLLGKRPGYRNKCRVSRRIQTTSDEPTDEKTKAKHEAHRDAIPNGEALEILVDKIVKRLRQSPKRNCPQRLRIIETIPNKPQEDSLKDPNEAQDEAEKLSFKDIPRILKGSAQILVYSSARWVCSVFQFIIECFRILVYFIKRCTYPNTEGEFASRLELTGRIKGDFRSYSFRPYRSRFSYICHQTHPHSIERNFSRQSEETSSC